MPQRYDVRLPRHLTPEQVDTLLAAVRAGRSGSRRNYAMLLLMARLGLAAAVRDYVAAVLTAAENDPIDLAPDGLEEWTSWALAHADALDPLRGGEPLLAMT